MTRYILHGLMPYGRQKMADNIHVISFMYDLQYVLVNLILPR